MKHIFAATALGVIALILASAPPAGARPGIPEDDGQPVQWHRMFAVQGGPTAQLNLGLMYATGNGVAQDYVQAYMWFAIAAAQGNKLAAKNRDIAEENMAPEQITEAKRLAEEWLAKSEKPE